MYVCGITPYDATHLGHAATMITFDLVQRMWRDAGRPVRYVQNVTDIDDPLLERAARDGEDWVVLAMRETALFREDMEALRIIPPAHYVGAVESIPDIADKVEVLLKDGAAYRLDDGTGDVYFDISATPRFGYESNLTREQMLEIFPERGGDLTGPASATHWTRCCGAAPATASRPGRAGPGAGPPGWHIECAVIALNLLGDRIDVQGGGNDLLFPHHEASAAHAERLTGQAPFAEHYVHAGMIGLDGEKMSKSRGNLVFVSRLRADKVDPMAIRLALISGHYRSDRTWTEDLLTAAHGRLDRWRRAAAARRAVRGRAAGRGTRTPRRRPRHPGALAAADRWADATLAGVTDDPEAPALFAKTVDALLGIRL
ncbi:cysteine--1-D-myo-inosityl 2-amino-2-deoxy-alpha-D-glucopyranoside ligase [Micromonospora sp. M12]